MERRIFDTERSCGQKRCTDESRQRALFLQEQILGRRTKTGG